MVVFLLVVSKIRVHSFAAGVSSRSRELLLLSCKSVFLLHQPPTCYVAGGWLVVVVMVIVVMVVVVVVIVIIVFVESGEWW